MTELPPRVIHWDTYPRDMTEPIKLFARSQFNYLHKNPQAGVVMGYWEVEQGEETLPDDFDLKPFHEIIVVLEGRLYVSGRGVEEQAAGPGDVVIIEPSRDTHVRVAERTRAFFLVYGTDIDSMEDSMRA
jgi:ethanolamine utilization protein EutQ (cupin superfamily)